MKGEIFDKEQEISIKENPSVENKEKEIGPEFIKKPDECQVAYLLRIGDMVTKKLREQKGRLFDVARFQEKDMPEDITVLIQEIVDEAQRAQEKELSDIKNDEKISLIENRVGYHGKPNLGSSEEFDKTERNRKFFEIQPGKGASKRETYWNTLFFPYNTEATRALAKQMLDGKKVVLLGGGRSKLKKELSENNIFPSDVINVDPFVENVQEDADELISVSASSEKCLEALNQKGIKEVDEIWAEYSVPAYLDDPKEIRQMVLNIDALLAFGGVARIWPIQVGGKGSPEELASRKNVLVESLKEITKAHKYEVILYEAAGRPGFVLRKLKFSEEEIQKNNEAQQIEDVRKKIESLV